MTGRGLCLHACEALHEEAVGRALQARGWQVDLDRERPSSSSDPSLLLVVQSGGPCTRGCTDRSARWEHAHPERPVVRVTERDPGSGWWVPLGATLPALLRAVERAAGRERPPARHETSCAPLLTERETEVLRLVAAGLPNPAIASRLGISVTTVRTHLQSIAVKLDVPHRLAAVARAREAGLLDGHEEADR